METSGLGIAALALGILSLLIAWIPVIGMLGVPVAGIGVLLGIAGVIVGRVNGQTGTTLPIVAVLICLVSIGVSYFTTLNRSGARARSTPPAEPAIDMTHHTGPFVPKPSAEDETRKNLTRPVKR